MRLSGIFKSFLHRRTKSCPTVLPSMVGAGAGFEIPPVVGQAPILPGGHPEQTSLTDEVFTMVTRMSLPEGTRTLQPSSATPKTSPIEILQRELSEFKESQVHLKSELSEAREALENTKVEAFAERRKHVLVQRELQAHKDEVTRLQERIGQLEIFTARLVNEDSGYSVLSSARELVLEGESADAALVSAIKEAASTPGSAWAQILLGVIGPRTQEEYISAINLCLITRRALKDNKKITKYWKGLALDDGNHSDAITPSPSDISSIHDVLSEERQNAVKALLESRKKLGGTIGLLQRPRGATEDVKSKTLSRIVEPSSSARSLPSDTSSRLDNSKSETALPPLASQVFKQELMASHSSRKHLRTSSRSSGSLAVTVSTSSMTGIMHQSSGSLEDWSFVDATLGDTGVSNSSSGPDSFTDILTAQLLSADVRINNDLREEKVSRARLSGGPLPFDNSAFAQLTSDFPAHLPNASTETSMSRGHGPDAQEDSDDGLLEAARALSSFERICAAIRSGSELGSLETISERTEPETESERGISRQPSLSPANGNAQKPPLPLKSILKNSHSSCPPTTPLPEPPTTKAVSVATERDTNKPTSKLPAPRKSLIPRTSNGNLAGKPTSTRSDSKPPLTAKSPQAMELSKSARPASDAKKAKAQQTVRIAKNSGSKASRKSSDKENNGGTNVISKGKKVIRGAIPDAPYLVYNHLEHGRLFLVFTAMEPPAMDPNVSTSRSRIAILGAGSVGSAIALCLILNPVASEVILVDPKTELRDAQVKDLEDATTYHGAVGGGGVRIRGGTDKEAGQCDVIVISAGAKQRHGESRTDLLDRNLHILNSAITSMKPFKKDAVILLVANPVDVLTYFARKYSGLPEGQVLGSGTFLDSARLRGLLADELDVDASSVDAYVLGEHGETQMVAWSCVTVGAVPLDQCLLPNRTLDRKDIAKRTKDKAGNIIAAKGATAYGIGALTASICNSILFDQRNVRPISHWIDDMGCCLSLPVVLGRKGVHRTLRMPLSDEEAGLLEESAAALRGFIAEAAKGH